MTTVTASSAANTCLTCGAPVVSQKWPFVPHKTRVVYCDTCWALFQKERDECQTK